MKFRLVNEATAKVKEQEQYVENQISKYRDLGVSGAIRYIKANRLELKNQISAKLSSLVGGCNNLLTSEDTKSLLVKEISASFEAHNTSIPDLDIGDESMVDKVKARALVNSSYKSGFQTAMAIFVDKMIAAIASNLTSPHEDKPESFDPTAVFAALEEELGVEWNKLSLDEKSLLKAAHQEAATKGYNSVEEVHFSSDNIPGSILKYEFIKYADKEIVIDGLLGDDAEFFDHIISTQVIEDIYSRYYVDLVAKAMAEIDLDKLKDIPEYVVEFALISGFADGVERAIRKYGNRKIKEWAKATELQRKFKL